jgi:hypothetical protein
MKWLKYSHFIGEKYAKRVVQKLEKMRDNLKRSKKSNEPGSAYAIYYVSNDEEDGIKAIPSAPC